MDLNHKMELMSISIASSICAVAGCDWSSSNQDFGIDLAIHGRDWSLDPQIDAQLKSTADLSILKSESAIVKYKIRAKNYNDLVKKHRNHEY